MLHVRMSRLHVASSKDGYEIKHNVYMNNLLNFVSAPDRKVVSRQKVI